MEKAVRGGRADQPPANLRLLKKILQPTRKSFEELRGTIETWEAEYQRYIGRVGEPLSDSVRRLTLQPMCPLSLSHRLDFRAAGLGAYALLCAGIDAYLGVSMAPSASEAMPMDVDSRNDHTGKGKG